MKPVFFTLLKLGFPILVLNSTKGERIFIVNNFQPPGINYGTVNIVMEGRDITDYLNEYSSHIQGANPDFQLKQLVLTKLEQIPKISCQFSPDYSYEYYTGIQ